MKVNYGRKPLLLQNENMGQHISRDENMRKTLQLVILRSFLGILILYSILACILLREFGHLSELIDSLNQMIKPSHKFDK